MKRAPTWLALTGVGVVLAALCLCDWIMGWWSELPADAASEPMASPADITPGTNAVVEVKRESSRAAAAAVAYAPMPAAPVPEPAPPTPEAPVAATPLPVFTAPPIPPPPPVSASGPQFVAPPGAIPPFILENAERTTQLVRGFTRGSWIVFGFYPDGSIRMVDLDGGRYDGRASSARAQMTEVDGARSFTLVIGVAADGRLQATFSGGIHDGQTIVLETIAEKPVA